MHLYLYMKVSIGQCFQKLEYEQDRQTDTETHTDRQTQLNALPTAFADGIIGNNEQLQYITTVYCLFEVSCR